MSTDVVIAIVVVVAFLMVVVTFIVGAVVGYGVRAHEEQNTHKDERIGSALKHWHGHTSHKGCTIFSPDVVEGGIR